MKYTHIALSAALTTVLVVSAPLAEAARIAGKQCAGMVSTQRNPQSGEVTRSCRAADGSIATERAK